ncbi:MAG: type II toxin-antitoxin system death-on-curing family toxin [Metamycoplasmataceae bacterium]
MKKIILNIFDDKINNPFSLFNKKQKNSKLSYSKIDDKYYLDLGSLGKEEINFSYSLIELNEKFANTISNFIEIAIKKADSLTNEPIVKKEDTIEKLNGVIKNTINYFSHRDKKDIFEFSSNIFIKFLSFHCFFNGNKRFSLAYLFLLLRYFGFHFKWSKGAKENYYHWENEIANFVVDISSKKYKPEELEIYIYLYELEKIV